MYKAAAVALLLISVTACGQKPPASYSTHGANAHEEIVARVPAQSVQRFMVALRAHAPDLTGNVSISEWRGDYGSTARAGADVYVAALDDARQKALAVARHIGAILGALESASEYGGGASAAPAERLLSLKGSPVLIRADGPVALAVAYSLSTGGSVSVFGLADPSAHGAPQGVDVSVNVTAPTVAEAWTRAGAVENYVRQTARAFGFSGTVISIANTGFDRY